MDNGEIAEILKNLKHSIKKFKVPAVGVIADNAIDKPFEVLVSTVISLRTKDAVTEKASLNLLTKAPTPHKMIRLSEKEIQKLIYPAGFYKTKAKSLLAICKILLQNYEGKVPRSIDDMVKLPGVGRKTANLVATLGFDDYGICVDVHVHRISNRWGYIKTKTADESEMVLRGKLPKKFWKTYNDILVTFGQNICQPVSPKCSLCPVEKYCPKLGVKHQR
ncbi:endonuclease III [bacterium]|nr:endonuclease III [bacterium]